MAQATHYVSGSRGRVAIETMNIHHAAAALDKLKRERRDASRDDEIEGLAAHVAKLSEEMAEQAVAS